jgi:hypothetical protein
VENARQRLSQLLGELEQSESTPRPRLGARRSGGEVRESEFDVLDIEQVFG